MRQILKQGKVVKVHDADTITVLYRKKEYVLRIANIDAPELSQEFGKVAQQKLSDFILDHKVGFDTLSVDKYGRYIAIVKFHNRLLHRWLVTYGLAWVYSLYCKDKVLYSLENKAKEKKLGLWESHSPEPPWLYRKKVNDATKH